MSQHPSFGTSTRSPALLQPEEHVLATLERDGTRRWLYPRLSKGYFWNLRRIIAYALIAFFVILPYVKIAGKPAVILDLLHRQFTFFGVTLLPTDTLLLALALLAFFLGIFLTTAIFGRIWCGWACPQTVYLEFIYRPIERFFDGTMGKGRKPSIAVPGWRKFLKYTTFLFVSLFLAHTFLAYFVGIDELSVWIRRSPFEHPVSFVIMFVTTIAVMFNFTWFREQLCLVACPYGRFQSVLLDRRSVIVAYDTKRGEPRGKLKTSLPLTESKQGDCIECGLCVQTCPTGIDIRNGLQMECVHCTQCMDACNEIMEKINKPKGLIRYSCQDDIDGKPHSILRPRLLIYPTLLIAVISAFFLLLSNRSKVDVSVIRNFGSPFSILENGLIQNNFKLKLTNRTLESMEVTLDAVDSKMVSKEKVVISGEHVSRQLVPLEPDTLPVLIAIPKDAFAYGQSEVKLVVKSQGQILKEFTCRMLGP